MYKLKGAGIAAARIETQVPNGFVDKKFWVSDLVSRYIGTAGVIEFELMRFLNSLTSDATTENFEKSFPQIMYWRWS